MWRGCWRSGRDLCVDVSLETVRAGIYGHGVSVVDGHFGCTYSLMQFCQQGGTVSANGALAAFATVLRERRMLMAPRVVGDEVEGDRIIADVYRQRAVAY